MKFHCSQVAVVAFSRITYPPLGAAGENCYSDHLAFATGDTNIAYLTEYISELQVKTELIRMALRNDV